MSMINDEIIDQVWQKGTVVEGINKNYFRKDPCGAWIAKVKYGDTSNPLGWEIDHVYPKQLGGKDDLVNLRPMNWQNNRSKSIDYPSYYSAVTASGTVNIESKGVYTVNDNLQKKLAELHQ